MIGRRCSMLRHAIQTDTRQSRKRRGRIPHLHSAKHHYHDVISPRSLHPRHRRMVARSPFSRWTKTAQRRRGTDGRPSPRDQWIGTMQGGRSLSGARCTAAHSASTQTTQNNVDATTKETEPKLEHRGRRQALQTFRVPQSRS